nr:MAG TPA: hypothetical protein [Inoviridae sp.]
MKEQLTLMFLQQTETHSRTYALAFAVTRSVSAKDKFSVFSIT